eukprot:TRINITY_DN7704_c0_g1_i1.p1 TRINITY_DN7704_c0_g1~~TRINITY_DN7704_c0_g1_i1.p1  ORF type:complete len:311 (+),score=49.08 TRINITY_DN7704_c0_g1_i1:70-933(+)
MYAVAQKQYVYIYDSQGVELHCMRNHTDVDRLEYLPYHFLLVTVGRTGFLKYQDVSTGTIIGQHRTRLGECEVMRQNPHNGVICLGHNNGIVTMWSPNITTPLVKMLCHKASILSLDVDAMGRYMVTSAMDGQVKIWDIRTYKELHSYFTTRPASSISISQTGLMGLSFGPHVQLWKNAFAEKQKSPYMSEQLSGRIIERIRFCPYEDVLGVSHDVGFSSMVVPGSGEANFDSFEANPYQSKKQKREHLVHSLLDKLSPEMITLNPSFIGSVDRTAIKKKSSSLFIV